MVEKAYLRIYAHMFFFVQLTVLALSDVKNDFWKTLK